MGDLRETFTTKEVAALLRIHPQTVTRNASRLNLGSDYGGRAGFRFTADDVTELHKAMKRKPGPAKKRRVIRRTR